MSEQDDFVVGEGPSFDRELPKEGSCAARVWRVFNVGMQPGFQNESPKPTVVIYFVTSHRYTTGDFKDKRILIYQKYRAGFGKFEQVKAKWTYLRRDVSSILGRSLTEKECAGLKLRSAIEGAPCLIEIIHEKGYANIKTIMSMPEGMPALDPDQKADPSPDYIPKFITTLRSKAVVQEKDDTDKVENKGWEATERPPQRPPTKEEVEIF